MNNFDDKHAQFAALRKARSLTAFSRLIGMEKRQLELLALHPKYKVFQVPKSISALRLIEDPSPPLKRVQSAVNKYLQSAYYFEKSFASYGFVANADDDQDKRNILANARKHLKRPWLLQIDLCDFFHYVSADKVKRIFLEPPFCFSDDLAEILSELTTYQNRLPMGAPTSPVLSNFACRDLDDRLHALAEARLWVFTRYADDMSFSSLKPFPKESLSEIRNIILEEGFEINNNKTKLSGPDEEKIITGILLRGKGELKPGFLSELETEIKRLGEVVEAQNYFGDIRTHWVEKMKQQTRGRITFAGFVLGNRHPDYQRIRDAFYVAITPPQEDFSAVSWRGFHYLT